MKTKIIEVKTREELDALGSAITVKGLSLGPDGSEAFADWCHELAAFKEQTPACYVTKGRVMNGLLGLTGSNAYRDDLNIVSFRLDSFANPGRLVPARFEVCAKWMDDVVRNDLEREAGRARRRRVA